MKISKPILCFFSFICVSLISAQVDIPNIQTTASANINHISSVNKTVQDWDIVFNYSLTSLYGFSGYAGVCYVTEWDEIWTSYWTSEFVDVWDVTDTSISNIWLGAFTEGVVGIRGMAYDGTYVYAGVNTDTIKVISADFFLVGEIIAPFAVRYVSFDPDADGGNGGFWIGNWDVDPTLIDRSGNVIRSIDFNSLGISSVYGGAYDYFSTDGPHLWLWAQGNGAGNPQNIVQINPSTGLPTGVQHDVMSDVGAAADSSIAGGLFVTNELIFGKVILGGILQGDEDLLFGYDITSSIIITFMPTVITQPATNVESTSVTLNGIVNPNGSETTYLFELGTTTSYGITVTNEDLLNGNNDISVNTGLIDLTPNTTYHYRIVATNSGGTAYGDDETFTTGSSTSNTPIVSTDPATNITSTTATLNGTVNPNGSNTTYTIEYGLTNGYGISFTPGGELTGTTNISVNTDLTGLTPNTTYHFRVSATNQGGTTFGDDASFTTNIQTADIDLEWRTLALSTFDWEPGNSVGYELLVRNNGTSPSGSFLAQLYISTNNLIDENDIAVGNSITYLSIPAGDSTLMSGSLTVPSINSGIYYSGAIVDINNSIDETNENNNSYTRNGKIVLGYQNTIQLTSTMTFNSHEETSSFRMIGLPGDHNMPITQILSGNYNEDWVAYHDNGNTSDYLVAYDGSNTFNFTPGNGFWILSKNGLNINQNVSSVTLESIFVNNGTYEIVYQIPLNDGWNIIANPFHTDVSWNAVQNLNLITESIHSFNGNFSSSSTFQPYQGYYFFNTNGLATLAVPFSGSGNLTKKVAGDNQVLKTANIELHDYNENISDISIGYDNNAKIKYDKYDKLIPPGDFEESRIYLYNKELQIDYKFLKTDIRENSKNQEYDIRVKHKPKASFNLVVKGIEYISAEAKYLVDHNFNFHNLTERKSILILPVKEISNMKLLVGDLDFIEMKRSQLLPNKFVLYQNYPNPFNPSTLISYSVPDESFVSLTVYDVLGREVLSLVKEKKPAGRYEVLFENESLSSGVYLYSLKTNNFQSTKKMILLK